jgi:DNA polymerase-4
MLLYEAVRGIDPSPVLAVGEKPQSDDGPRVRNRHQRRRDVTGGALPSGGAGRRRARRRRHAAQRVAVLLDYSDGARCIRQAATRPATANDIALFEIAGRALDLAWVRRVRVRRLRLICDRLVFPPAQLALFDDDRQPAEKHGRLIRAVDTIRHRFGGDAVQLGRTLAA